MTLNVVVCGCGKAGKNHIRKFSSISDVNVIAVCDKDPNYAKKVAEELNVPNAYGTLEETLKKEEKIDAVSICSIPQDHLKDVETAFKYNCHVLCEKPIAMNMDEVKKMKKASEKAGKIFSVVHNHKFSPMIKEGVKKVKNGAVGDVLRISYWEMRNAEKDRMAVKDHWCHDLKGGRFGETLPHMIYTMYQMVGELKVISVDAKLVGKKHPWLGADEATVLLEHKNGYAEIHLSENTGNLSIGDMLVSGTNGAIMCTNGEVKNLFANEKGVGAAIKALKGGQKVSGPDSHDIIIKGFVKEVTEGAESLVPWEEAYHTMDLVDQIGAEIDKVRKK